MPPERAARIIVDGVEAGRPRILVGRDAKAVDLLVRLLPRRYPRSPSGSSGSSSERERTRGGAGSGHGRSSAVNMSCSGPARSS